MLPSSCTIQHNIPGNTARFYTGCLQKSSGNSHWSNSRGCHLEPSVLPFCQERSRFPPRSHQDRCTCATIPSNQPGRTWAGVSDKLARLLLPSCPGFCRVGSNPWQKGGMQQLPHRPCPAAGHDRAICHGHQFHCPLSASRNDCTAIALPLEDVIQRLSRRTTCLAALMCPVMDFGLCHRE